MDLDDRPSFNALRYHGGKEDNDPKYTIFCGSQTMKVGKNCWDALWHLRERYKSIDIWIDAICIDQKNQKEKASQIPLMGDIYRKRIVSLSGLEKVTMKQTGQWNFSAKVDFRSTSLLTSPTETES
jgi:hypothetical protein